MHPNSRRASRLVILCPSIKYAYIRLHDFRMFLNFRFRSLLLEFTCYYMRCCLATYLGISRYAVCKLPIFDFRFSEKDLVSLPVMWYLLITYQMSYTAFRNSEYQGHFGGCKHVLCPNDHKPFYSFQSFLNTHNYSSLAISSSSGIDPSASHLFIIR